jgi:hypothetical protein
MAFQSWTQLVSVRYEHPPQYWWPQMCLCEDDGILMLFDNQNFKTYNLRDNSVKSVQLPDNKGWTVASDYVPSLVSPY